MQQVQAVLGGESRQRELFPKVVFDIIPFLNFRRDNRDIVVLPIRAHALIAMSEQKILVRSIQANDVLYEVVGSSLHAGSASD
jgi:hypothetical protein